MAGLKLLLDNIPEDRHAATKALRRTIKKNLPKGYKETISESFVSYCVPHKLCPDGYHCDPSQPVPFVSIAPKGKKMSLHFFGIYVDRKAKDRFVKAWKATGLKLDMGASCVRFKQLEDIPLDVIGDAVASMPVEEFLQNYEASVPKSAAKKRGHKS